MKVYSLLLLIFLEFVFNGLYSDIKFENDKAIKTHIPVTCYDICPTMHDLVTRIKSFDENFESKNSLAVRYEEDIYYIPISKTAEGDIFNYLKLEDSLYIDIVIFNMELNHNINKYLSYISKIEIIK